MKVKFKEIANFIAGQSPKSEYYNENKNGMAFLQGNRTFGRMYPNIDTYTTKVTKVANVGDILISVRAPVGELNIANETVCAGRGLGIVNSDKYSNNFIYYALIYNIKNLIKQGNGTTFSSITKDIINEFTMIVPDKDIDKIEELLFSIDKIIENNIYLQEQLEETIETIYNYWFLQFDFPNEDGKPYRSSGGEMVYNEKLKMEIPMGWKVNKLENCLDHIKTGLNPRKNFDLNRGNIKYITVKNLDETGKINFDNCDTVDNHAKNLIQKRADLKKGDVLYASIAPLGRCHLIMETPETWTINESVFSLRTNEKINSFYLFSFLKSEEFIRTAENSSFGSIFKGIRINVINEMCVKVPTKYILDKFKDIVSPMHKQIYNLEKENVELEELKNYLLPLLMNGQVGFKENNK